MKLLILLFILLCLVFLQDKREGFISYKKCGRIPVVIKEIYKNKEFNEKNEDYDLYFPCGYNYIENELKTLKLDNFKQKVYGISGCDSIVAKDTIWSLLYKYYNKESDKIMPRTYITRNHEDINRFISEFVPGKYYLLKKNVQRQLGIEMYNNKNNILQRINDDPSYAVIQELLTDPFLINKRKINLRVYMLVICKKGNVRAYYHKNGFMYYTKELFDKNNITYDNVITTGYIDRQVYVDNPLTLNDFRGWLNKNNYSSNKLDMNIKNNLKSVIIAVKNNICRGTNTKNNTTFQLFGTDLAPDSKLDIKIMELNKGPDMSFKDERDGEVKKKLNKDIFNLLDLYTYDDKTEKNEFIQIY